MDKTEAKFIFHQKKKVVETFVPQRPSQCWITAQQVRMFLLFPKAEYAYLPNYEKEKPVNFATLL